MMLACNMQESIEIIKEKIEWIKNFFEQINLTTKRSAELLFRASQIPRKTSWQDSYILELVEMCDKQRLQHDKLSSFYEITVIKDANELYDIIESELKERTKDKEAIMQNTKTLYNILEEKRHLYVNSLKNDTDDPWLRLAELKLALSNYIIEKELSEEALCAKTQGCKKKLDDIYDRYRNIIRNFMKIQANHYKNLCAILECDDVEKKFYELEEEVFYDFDPDDNEEFVESIPKKENHESYLESQFIDIIDQIHSNLKINFGSNETTKNKNLNTNKVNVIKYGIFKYKKASRSTWRSIFIVLTDKLFIHGFDIDFILQNSPNIAAEYNLIYKRILGSTESIARFLPIFDNRRKIESLNFNEEKELQDLASQIIKEANLINSLIKNFSFRICDKSIKLDKEKFEIHISSKGANSFTNFFVNNTIKLKSFILKDLYELLFGFHKSNSLDFEKIENNKNTLDETTNKNFENQQIESNESPVIDGHDSQYIWPKIEENNPWEE